VPKTASARTLEEVVTGRSSVTIAWRTQSTLSGVPHVSGSGADCPNLLLLKTLRRSAASSFNAMPYRYVRAN
jgi:hypothetical protein